MDELAVISAGLSGGIRIVYVSCGVIVGTFLFSGPFFKTKVKGKEIDRSDAQVALVIFISFLANCAIVILSGVFPI